MKPAVEGNGNGWHRVEIEAVAYALNRLLGMDYVPPCIFRTNAECDWQRWPKSIFMYWAEGGQELQRVPLDAWAGIPSAALLSDARVIDTLIHNSDRCHDHLMMAEHWALGEARSGGGSDNKSAVASWRGQRRPVFIDHAAGFRREARVNMTQDNAFKTGPTTVISASTYSRLR